jgi:hypothetical protein
LPIVWKRQPIGGVGIAHPLDEFAERPEEVVDLLRLKRYLALGLEDESSERTDGIDVDATFPPPSHVDVVALTDEVITDSALDLVLGEMGPWLTDWHDDLGRRRGIYIDAVHDLAARSLTANEPALRGQPSADLVDVLTIDAQTTCDLVVVELNPAGQQIQDTLREGLLPI